jgi:hypothetical protein
MRCLACNTDLNDYESTRKDANGRYLDLCNTCFRATEYEFSTDDRLDLIDEADIQYENNSGYDHLTYDSDTL